MRNAVRNAQQPVLPGMATQEADEPATVDLGDAARRLGFRLSVLRDYQHEVWLALHKGDKQAKAVRARHAGELLAWLQGYRDGRSGP